MSKISEERLDQMLTNLCKAEPGQPFVYRPQEEEKPAVVPFYRRYRGLAAAAVLVFVSVVSLTIFFLFGNKPTTPIPVAPAPHGTNPSVSETAGSDTPTDSNLSSQSPSGHGREDATSPTSSRSSATVNRRTPTSKATSPPAAATEPTGAPEPTERVKPTEKPVFPTVPMDPPWDDPTDGDEPWLTPPTENGGMQEVPPVEFYASFDADRLPDDRMIYCKVYDWRGRRLGDRDLYSSEHAASIEYIKNGTVLVRYLTPEGLIVMDGSYSYVFYDSSGAILAQGQDYVEW